MIPPFGDHPVVQQYNQIKLYFRQHETAQSRERIVEFRRTAQLFRASGIEVAFDFVGSLNFGQAVDASDVDCILYYRCPEHPGADCPPDCSRLPLIREEVLSMISSRVSRQRYRIEMIDALNIGHLQSEIARGDATSEALLAFAFYRSIGRAVNARLLRPIQQDLVANQKVLEQMKPQLWEIFDALSQSSRHRLSFKKYQQRVEGEGKAMPGPVGDAIRKLLEFLRPS